MAKRRAWTKDDVRELKVLARQKTPAAKIAKSLKRTLAATWQKASTLGVSFTREPVDTYSVGTANIVAAMRNSAVSPPGLPVPQVNAAIALTQTP